MSTYTPPPGNSVPLDFTGGPYTPPAGNAVPLEFRLNIAPGDDQFVFPLGWASSDVGQVLVTGTLLTPAGWASGAWGTPSVINFAEAIYPGGIAPPPQIGPAAQCEVPPPWVSFWTRTLDLVTPSEGIGPPTFPANHIVAFEIQFLDLAGRGIDSACCGDAHRVEFTFRTVYPFTITSQAFGSALIAKVQLIQPSGWENTNHFGDHQLDINLQRVLLVGYGIPVPTITDQHHIRNHHEYLNSWSWDSLTPGFPVVYNLRQEIFVLKYADDADPTTWPHYSPFVENKIRYLRPSGWMSSRFSVIGNVIENAARALCPDGWDGFTWGQEGFIAHYTRYVAPESWDSFYNTHYHVVYNAAALVRPLSWHSGGFGRPDPVLNLNRTVRHHSGPADGFYGTAFVADAIRYVAPRVFVEPFWPVPEIRLNPYPIAPSGIAIPPTTAPHVREHFNVLSPRSVNVHSVPWVGEPFIRNRNMTLAVYPSDQAEYGRARVFNYDTEIDGFTAGDLSLWGAHLISYRTKTLYPVTPSVPVFPVLHRIKNDTPDPPAQRTILVPTINRNINDTFGTVSSPTLNYHSIFPEGWRSEDVGAPTIVSGTLFVWSIVNLEDLFGVPALLATQYVYPQSLPPPNSVVPGTQIPAGDSDSFWTKNLYPGYEWPRLSPHMIYAPAGDMASRQAVENNPPYPEPEYHVIDGTQPAGYADSRHPAFGATWVSLKNRAIGPVPNHQPGSSQLAPSSEVSQEATFDLRQRWIYPEGVRSLRMGRVVFWGVPQYVNLDPDHDGIPPGDAYDEGDPPPNMHVVARPPEFHRTLPIPGTNMLVVGGHEVQNFHREVLPAGINHRGNPQQGLTSPWGVPLVGFPREYAWGGHDFTLWGDTWLSHYTRHVYPEGWRSSTLEDYPISGFNDRMRVRLLPFKVRSSSVGESLQFGTAMVDFARRAVITQGFSGYNTGCPVLTSSCVLLPSGWESSEFGDIDEWEAGKIKPHGDDLSAVGTPKLRHPVRPSSFHDGEIGQVRVGVLIYVTGLPPIGFDGPSVTDPFGCSTRVVTPLPVLSQEFVPLPEVT